MGLSFKKAIKQLKERNETQARVGIDHFENVLWAYRLLATPALPDTLCIHERRLVKNVFLF